jgi:hypothetical protein
MLVREFGGYKVGRCMTIVSTNVRWAFDFCNTCQFWVFGKKKKKQIERTIGSGYQQVQRTTKFDERTRKDPTGFKAII